MRTNPTMPMAYRAEAIAYCVEPHPGMFHLGDSYALRPDAVQQWAADRAAHIAASLGAHHAGTACQFLAWARHVTADHTGELLQAGHSVTYTHTDSDCLWQLALRPVPEHHPRSLAPLRNGASS
ncbi:hypothetical protein [Streptomyces sodiiphilus]